MLIIKYINFRVITFIFDHEMCIKNNNLCSLISLNNFLILFTTENETSLQNNKVNTRRSKLPHKEHKS